MKRMRGERRPATMTKRLDPVAALRLGVFLAGLLPLARLLWLGCLGGLTANPLEFVTRSTGTWGLVFLCASLSITPLRRLTGWPGWAPLRRTFGLYGFFYAVLHVALWAWVDRGLDAAAIGRDVVQRPFITAGFVAFVLLMPLAATSTRGMIGRLGQGWRRLHRLAYPIVVLAVLHYFWHKAGKNDFAEVGIYAVLVAALLGVRAWWAVRDGWRARRQKTPGT